MHTCAGCAEASKTEGGMFSIIAGKEGAAKLSETTKKWTEETTKKLAETSRHVAHTVKEVHASPGGFAKWVEGDKSREKPRKSTVPKPDDFFTDFGGDDFPTPAKLKEAKKTGAIFDDDFDFPAPAKPVGSKKAPAKADNSENDPELAAAHAEEPVRRANVAAHTPALSEDTAPHTPAQSKETVGHDIASTPSSLPERDAGLATNTADPDSGTAETCSKPAYKPATGDGWDDVAWTPSPGAGSNASEQEVQLHTDHHAIQCDVLSVPADVSAHASATRADESPGGGERHDGYSNEVCSVAKK